MTQEPQNLSPEIQQKIGMVNLRLQDFIREFGEAFNLLVTENQALRKEIAELKTKPKTEKPE